MASIKLNYFVCFPDLFGKNVNFITDIYIMACSIENYQH